MRRNLQVLFVSLFAFFSPTPYAQHACAGTNDAAVLKFETHELTNGGDPITVQLAYRPGVTAKYSAILIIGSLKNAAWETNKTLPEFQVPSWSSNLINEGYMVAAFTAHHPVDPDPARRPQWLFFDERFAHSYVEGGYHAPKDAGRVIDFLSSRGNVQKFGWVGSSSTGIPGLSVATREPRLNAIVAFVSTGAYRDWLNSWHSNKLWRGKTDALWPETESLLREHDPILHVNTMYPCAVLMVSGGADKVVDPATARAFVNAAQPFYKDDPDRLRLVVYDGFGHNLPADVVPMYIENWFHIYLNPNRPAPQPAGSVKDLNESVRRTSITGTDHKEIMKAK